MRELYDVCGNSSLKVETIGSIILRIIFEKPRNMMLPLLVLNSCKLSLCWIAAWISVSDDDEIDYSTKPEFYDSDLDVKDESWVTSKRKGQRTDAVLSCPACFTTLCIDCQRYSSFKIPGSWIFVLTYVGRKTNM